MKRVSGVWGEKYSPTADAPADSLFFSPFVCRMITECVCLRHALGLDARAHVAVLEAVARGEVPMTNDLYTAYAVEFGVMCEMLRAYWSCLLYTSPSPRD